MRTLSLAMAILLLGGCSIGQREQNPDFPALTSGLTVERERMIESPTGLERPLVVVGGWRTPSLTAAILARDLRRLTGGDTSQTLVVGMLTCNSMASGTRRIVAAIEHAWPSDDPERTIEVDVVGISMGGLLSRAASLPGQSSTGKQLNIRRLFTLATPHRGSSLARCIAIDALARDMRSGSAFLTILDESLETCDYELFCYARTHDFMVGATNTAPPGRDPYWLSGPLLFSHVTISADPLIRLDIARRLRNEEPIARQTSPPPAD